MAASAVPDLPALGAVPLFHGLSPDELDRLHELLHRRVYPPGASVITAEEPGAVAYIVLDGTVKVEVARADGAVVILAILRAGEVVGEMSLVDRLWRSATVVTVEASTLAWLARGDFWECLRMMPAMTYNLVGILSRRLRLANAQVEALAVLDVDGRVARQLLAFAEEYGEPAPGGGRRIPFRLTQEDLAHLVGASRVRVNQVLGAYRRRNCLAIDEQRRITVLDPARLAEDCA